MVDYNKNYYEILGIKKDYRTKEIKKAYRELSLKFHPDKNPDQDAKSKFIEVAEAYEVLSDPEIREDYELNYQNIDFALFKAFVTQNITIAEVEDYLAKGANINAHNALGQTILMFAANRGNIPMVDVLIKNSASIDEVDADGNTALMYGANKELVSFSVDNADIIKTRKEQREHGFSTQWQEQKETAQIAGNGNYKTPEQQAWDDILDPPLGVFPPETITSKLELLFPSLDAVAIACIFTPLYIAKQKYAVPLMIIMFPYGNIDKIPQELYSFGIFIHKQLSKAFESNTKINSTDTKNEPLKDEPNKEYQEAHKKQYESQKQLYQNKAAALQILLDNHANIELTNKYGYTAFDYAQMSYNLYILNLFYGIFGMNDKIVPEDKVENMPTIEISTSVELYHFPLLNTQLIIAN